MTLRCRLFGHKQGRVPPPEVLVRARDAGLPQPHWYVGRMVPGCPRCWMPLDVPSRGPQKTTNNEEKP